MASKLLPWVKEPVRLEEGKEEFRFLPPAEEVPEDPAAMASPEMFDRLQQQPPDHRRTEESGSAKHTTTAAS
jgi:hypothetical protein